MFLSAYCLREPNIPQQYWEKLTLEEQLEYKRLHSHFSQSHCIASTDPQINSFSSMMTTVMHFNDFARERQEYRSLASGAAFAGPILCINPRVLSKFLGRTKSSILIGLEKMGYKSSSDLQKSKSCLIRVLPSLLNDQITMRQWVVFHVTEDSLFCFYPKYMMETTIFDLMGSRPKPAVSTQSKRLDLNKLTEVKWFNEDITQFPNLPSSFSTDTLSSVEEEEWNMDMFTHHDWNPMIQGCQKEYMSHFQNMSFELSEPNGTYD